MIIHFIGYVFIFVGLISMAVALYGLGRTHNMDLKLIIASQIDTTGFVSVAIGLMLIYGLSWISVRILLILIIWLFFNPVITTKITNAYYQDVKLDRNNRLKWKHPSDVTIIQLMMPILFLIGFYLLLFGNITPGGGFQAGAVFTSIIVYLYWIMPFKNINLNKIETIEKTIFSLLIILSLIFISARVFFFEHTNYLAYMTVMNIFLGIKVFCGLSIIFISFMKAYGPSNK